MNSQVYFNVIIDMIVFGISALLSLSFPIVLRFKGKTAPLMFTISTFLVMLVLGLVSPYFFRMEHLTWQYVYLEYMSACFIGLNWFIFSLYTLERHKRWLMPFFILPAVSYLVISFVCTSCQRFVPQPIKPGALSINMFDLFYTPYYYINRIPIWMHYSILAVSFVAGAAFLGHRFFRQRGFFKTFLLILTATVPFVVNVLPIIFANYLHHVFYTSLQIRSWLILAPYLGYLLALIALTVLAFKYSVVDVIPIALRKLVDNMNAMMVLVDIDNKILDFNQSLVREFCADRPLRRKEHLIELIDQLEGNNDRTPGNDRVFAALRSPSVAAFNGELGQICPQTRFYSVTIQPILFAHEELLGRIITFNDITEYRNLLEEVNEKNEELKQYASTVEELTIVKERNRFAHDVHDTLGHTMTLLIALLEVAKVNTKKNPDMIEEKLDKAIEAARAGLTEIRRSIAGLVPENLETHSLTRALRNIINDFQSSGLTVDFNIDGKEIPCSQAIRDAIFRVCQEALTNSLRHGLAKHVSILLRYDANDIKLFIFDDGRGCTKIVKGMGLSGMEKRVHALHGTLVYGSDGENGFNIRVELPLNLPRSGKAVEAYD